MDYEYLIKVVVAGDSGTGKTALVKQMAERKFDPSYISTIGVDFTVMEHKLDSGQIAKVQLWDTAGQERFRTITQSYYRGAHIILLVIDMTSADSLENCHSWIRDIQQHVPEHAEIMILVNKNDVEAHKRAISPTQLIVLQEQTKLPVHSVSAKTGDKVDFVLHSIVEQYVKEHFEQARLKRKENELAPIRIEETRVKCGERWSCC